MRFNRTNILVYVVIAVVVLAAVFFVARNLINPAYSVVVSMSAYMPNSIYPFNVTVFRVNVTNTGSSQIKDMPLGFYVNDNETHFYNVTVPPHESANLNITYTFGNPGNYTFKAVADPGMITKISDRQHATATISGIHVNIPISPNFYTPMPNGTASSNNFFAFSQRGIYAAVAIAQSFGLNNLTSIFSNNMYLGELASIINDMSGATVSYKNGTTISSVWMQGSLSPFWVNYSLGAYHIKANAIKKGNGMMYYYSNNGTLTCAFYQSGWTRLLEYSNPGNTVAANACSNINATYKNDFNTSLVASLNASHVYNYTESLVYKNSTGLGEAVTAGPNNTTRLANFYQNGFGTFISVVTRHNRLNVSALKLNCLGLVYSSNSVNACSSIILPVSNSIASGFNMLNTTEVLPNYTLTLYSIVNQTNLLSAHYSAISLFNSTANTLGPSAPWSSAFKNTCSLGSNSIGCSVNGFNFSTNTASISIKNGMSSSVKLDSIACSMYINGTAEKLNETILPGASKNVTVGCTTIPVPVFSAFDIYNLTTGYTYGGSTYTLHGSLNITNFFQG